MKRKVACTLFIVCMIGIFTTLTMAIKESHLNLLLQNIEALASGESGDKVKSIGFESGMRYYDDGTSEWFTRYSCTGEGELDCP